LRSIALRFDDQDTLRRESILWRLQPPSFESLRQTGRTNIKAQMNGARHLVHMLSARALCANGRELDL
jgi:hypothetical protein